MTLNKQHEESEAQFLKNYDPDAYEKPSVTVDTLLFRVFTAPALSYKHKPEKELSILLIKRGGHPYQGCWAIPGGFVNIEESLETAAYRELKEETNIQNVYLEQLYTFGDVGRDPRMRVISTSYLALTAQTDIEPKAGDDAREAKWFMIKDGEECLKLISEDGVEAITYVKNKKDYLLQGEHGLAFDHLKILLMGLERIRNKVDYTDIVFTLLPDVFTLNEIQRVFEAILGETLDTSNFRKSIKRKLIKTDLVQETGRKVALYRYDPCWKKKENIR